jgi:transposase-like protein
LETPRDRKATFDPKIVAKGQTRWTGFDDKIISMYARGMTTRRSRATKFWLQVLTRCS